MTEPRVLIVESDPSVAEWLAFLFTTRGARAFVHRDGAAALISAAEQHPDVILIDTTMAGIGGYQLCRRLRATSWGEKTLIASLGRHDRRRDKLRARTAGFDLHILKPGDIDTLQSLLR